MRNHTLFGIILILVLTACSGTPPTTSVPTTYQITQTSTVEVLDQDLTPTLIPSKTETATPTSELVKNPVVIEPGNAGQLTEVMKLGKGSILSDPSYAPEGMPIYSPDGKWMAIPTSAGIYLYDAGTLEELRTIPVSTPFIAFTPDASLLAASGHGNSHPLGPGNRRTAGRAARQPGRLVLGAVHLRGWVAAIRRQLEPRGSRLVASEQEKDIYLSRRQAAVLSGWADGSGGGVR